MMLDCLTFTQAGHILVVDMAGLVYFVGCKRTFFLNLGPSEFSV